MMFTDASMPFLHPKKNPIVFLTHTKERAGEWALNWHRVTPEHVDHMTMVESLLAVTSQCPLGLITMAVMMASCANWLKHCWYLSHWDMKGILVRLKRMHENLKHDTQRALPEYMWLPEPNLYWDMTIAHLPLLCLTMMARVPPWMILSKKESQKKVWQKSMKSHWLFVD